MTCLSLMLLYPQLLLLVLLLLGHTQHALSIRPLLLHSTQASLLTRWHFTTYLGHRSHTLLASIAVAHQ